MPKTNVGSSTQPRARIEASQAARRAHPLYASTNAFRVVNGPADQAPAGLAIDRYAEWLVVTARAELADAVVAQWCDAAAQLADVRGVILKRLSKPISASSSQLWGGESPPRPLPVREYDARILCDLDDGISTGLFLDQRDVRHEARAFARDVDVLNLFAYTGAFSVHAALAGARRVTSIDASRRALARGRDNMRASGIDPDAHRWFPDDVATHLARARRRGDTYGLVILDPPMFGRAGSKVHSLEHHLTSLVTSAAAVVANSGVLVVSTHALEVSREALASVVRDGAGTRRTRVLGEHGLPAWDHPARDDGDGADRGDYLKTVVVRLD